MARSESNAVGNSVYTDLNMTRYPQNIDNRTQGSAQYNVNMRGYENFKDRVMAEHVNSLFDASMAIQRTLGINPQIPSDGRTNTSNTVSGRITLLEDPTRYDLRYGGAGWDTTQTIVAHKHTGLPGSPSKVSLTAEVVGALPKNNINLTQTGLTGADIRISPSVATKIDVAIDDRLSRTSGGTISGPVSFTSKTSSRFHAELDYQDATDGQNVTDNTASFGQSVTSSGTALQTLFNVSLPNLAAGDYFVTVRARVTNASLTNDLIRIRTYNRINGNSVLSATKIIKANDFEGTGWKTFHLLTSVLKTSATQGPIIQVQKLSTATSQTIYIDYAYVHLAKPAVFDA